MKYFTPDMYVRFQLVDDNEADAVDDEWERAVDSYQVKLEEIWEALPQPTHDLIDRYYLHDAQVLSMARNEQSLIMTVRLDPAPHDCLILIYTLDGEPRIDTASLPPELASRQVQWMYDELDIAPGSQSYSHEILLSNGWCVSLCFKTVQVISAAELLPDERGIDRRDGSLARTA